MTDDAKPVALIPIEEMILGGFATRLQQVFGCMFVVTNEHEKTKAIQRMVGGQQVKYPYGFVSINTFDTTTQTYNPHYFVRHGIEVFVKSDQQLHAMHCMPCAIEVEIEYHTNVFLNSSRVNSTKDANLSAAAFMRRWVMAARAGYTKFMVNYGQTEFGINVILSPSVTAPKKDNLVENEQVYVTTATATIQGWVSEPILKRAGIVREIRLGVDVQAPVGGDGKPIEGRSTGRVYFPRPGYQGPEQK